MIIKFGSFEIRTGTDVTTASKTIQNSQQDRATLVGTDIVVHDPNQDSGNNYHDEEPKQSVRDSHRFSLGDLFSRDKRLKGVRISNENPSSVRRSRRREIIDKLIFPPPPAINDVLDYEIYANKVNKFRTSLIKDRYFSICDVRELIELCQVRINERTKKPYAYLGTLHCKDYDDMDERELELLVTNISSVFTEGVSEDQIS